jgi:predicted RNA binding protein YcfA (HicA-like mRNA interferase family)
MVQNCAIFFVVNAREVIKKLKSEGWVEARHSKHLILVKDDKICPIPMHGKKDLKIGTLKSIEEITEVKLR